MPPPPTTNHLPEWPEHGKLHTYAFVSILVLYSDFILLRQTVEGKYCKCATRNKRLSNICTKVTFKNDKDNRRSLCLRTLWKEDKSDKNFILLFPVALRPNAGRGLLMLEVSRSYTTTQHSWQDSSGRVISSLQRPLPDNTQHSQQTDIYAPGGIRTHNLSRRAAVHPHLRPRGHWDRQILHLLVANLPETARIHMSTNLLIFCDIISRYVTTREDRY